MMEIGGPLGRRPLHFVWLADCSGSMDERGKIQSLNTAIREVIPHMQKEARDNPEARVMVRAIKFSDGAQWHVAQATPVEDFKWTDLGAGGLTAMGAALRMLADQLKMPPMEKRGLPPVLVLVSDGMPTDDFEGGLQGLMGEPWGKRAVRMAIAIGDDADLDVLQRFIGHPELKPLVAKNPEQLVSYIHWTSMTGIRTASRPPSQPGGASAPLPQPTMPPAPVADPDEPTIF